MSIHYLLYRCPTCGHDPTTATRRGARCESCGTTFEQGRAGSVLVRSSEGKAETASVDDLIEAIDHMGGPTTRAEDGSGAFSYEASVVASSATSHQTVWWRGGVLGFFERITDRREATLRLSGSEMILVCRDRERLVWGLERIDAMQISSRAIQLNIRDAGLQQMEFLSDSPKRWEDLLRLALDRFYALRGREVVEYQPKVVTRALS
jgi:hypothetical protein